MKTFAWALLVSGLSLFTLPSGATDWTTINGSPAATGFVAETVEPPLQLRWRFPANGGFYFSPAVVEGVVYVGCLDYNVYAIEAETGEFRWAYHTGAPVFSGVSVADGMVYVGSSDSTVYALEAQTGRLVWKHPVDGQVFCPPLVYQGIVCVGTFEGATLFGIDAKTGERRWTFDMGQRVGSALAADGGTIFAGSYDSNLYALDPRTGKLRWAFRAEGIVDSCPAVKDGRVYIKLPNDDVYALDAKKGEEIWRYDSGQPDELAAQTSNWSPLSVAHGLVYFGSNDHHVYALDADTGKLEWRFETGEEEASSPTIAGEVAYFGTKGGTLYAVEAKTGELLWRRQPEQPVTHPFPRGIMWPPAVVKDSVYVSTCISETQSFLYAFNGIQGETVPEERNPSRPRPKQTAPQQKAKPGGNIFEQIERAED